MRVIVLGLGLGLGLLGVSGLKQKMDISTFKWPLHVFPSISFIHQTLFKGNYVNQTTDTDTVYGKQRMASNTGVGTESLGGYWILLRYHALPNVLDPTAVYYHNLLSLHKTECLGVTD